MRLTDDFIFLLKVVGAPFIVLSFLEDAEVLAGGQLPSLFVHTPW